MISVSLARWSTDWQKLAKAEYSLLLGYCSLSVSVHTVFGDLEVNLNKVLLISIV